MKTEHRADNPEVSARAGYKDSMEEPSPPPEARGSFLAGDYASPIPHSVYCGLIRIPSPGSRKEEKDGGSGEKGEDHSPLRRSTLSTQKDPFPRLTTRKDTLSEVFSRKVRATSR